MSALAADAAELVAQLGWRDYHRRPLDGWGAGGALRRRSPRALKGLVLLDPSGPRRPLWNA
ncbi:MAG: hypothetical protein U0531_14450 [Dehalococcoidia bacterium]